jgi:hypothetical protein
MRMETMPAYAAAAPPQPSPSTRCHGAGPRPLQECEHRDGKQELDRERDVQRSVIPRRALDVFV